MPVDGLCYALDDLETYPSVQYLILFHDGMGGLLLIFSLSFLFFLSLTLGLTSVNPENSNDILYETHTVLLSVLTMTNLLAQGSHHASRIRSSAAGFCFFFFFFFYMSYIPLQIVCLYL